jgi:hypothetical protein
MGVRRSQLSGFHPPHLNHSGTENTEKPQRNITTPQYESLWMVLRWVGIPPLCGSVRSVPLWFGASLEPISMDDSAWVMWRSSHLLAATDAAPDAAL